MNKVGRNDPCPCGSGKKYKKCHLGDYDPEELFLKSLPTMPLHSCWGADDYDIIGLSPVVVRKHYDLDWLVIASFICDVFCLGVKDVLFEQNATEDRLDFILDRQLQDMVEIDYEEAREIILGAVRYANNLGFTPHAGYEKAKYAIEYDTPFRYDDKHFGRDGKPFYYIGPNDNYKEIFETLDKNAGKGKFDYEIDERVKFDYDG